MVENYSKTLILCIKNLTEELNLIAPKIDAIYVPLKEAISKTEEKRTK